TTADLPLLADLMAGSPLLQRYGVTRETALGMLQDAYAQGDLLLVAKAPTPQPPPNHAYHGAPYPHGMPTMGPPTPAACAGEGEQAVGLAWVIPTRILNGGAYLRLLLVAEAWSGRGLGGRLLAEVEDRARAFSNHLYFLVTADNVGARRFYERHGCRLVGSLPGLVRPDLDEILYYKELRSHAERLAH